MLAYDIIFLLRLRETHNALQLPVFFLFSFFCLPCSGLRNCKSVFDSNETKAGDSDVIPSRLRDKLKTYLHYQSAFDHQTWQDGNLR